MIEEQIKSSLRLIFVKCEDEPLLDLITERIAGQARFIDSLDNSYEPMKGCVEHLYGNVEQNIIYFRQQILLVPDKIRGLLRTTDFESERYAMLEIVARALVKQEVENYYSRYNLRSDVYTHNLAASFSTARKITEEKEVEIGVAIGPEGFAYGALFKLLDLPVLDIHIDEYCLTEDRPYQELDDLSAIKGRHVLFIEDDVRTGRTLEKAYQNINRYSPSKVSVYLGIPEERQELKNVPRTFDKIYTVPSVLPDMQTRAEIDALIEVLERKYSIFKPKVRD